MELAVRIRSFMKIAAADFTVGGQTPIVLIGGPNDAGKTSITDAVIATLTGNAFARGTRKKDELLSLVTGNTGKAECRVTITDERGTSAREIRWPTGEIVTEGEYPPAAAAEIIRIGRFIHAEREEKARFLTEILKALPEEGDINAAMSEAGFKDPNTHAKMNALIAVKGWDGAAMMLAEVIKKKKSEWAIAAREHYGSQKAKGWVPTGYDPVIMSAWSLEALQLEANNARLEHERALGSVAVDGATIEIKEKEIEALRIKAASVEAFEADVKDLQQSIADLQDATRELMKKPLNPGYCCPGCKLPLSITQLSPGEWKVDEGQPVQVLAADEIKKIRLQIAESEGKIRNAQTKYTEAQRSLTEARAAAATISRLETELAELRARTGDATITQRTAETLTQANNALNAFMSWRDASAAQKTIETNERLIATVLDPADGLRARMLRTKIDELNVDLAEMSAFFGIPTVALDFDLEISIGRRPYRMSGEAYRHLADFVVQLSLSKHLPQPLLVVDRMDVFVAPAMRAKVLQIAMKRRQPILGIVATTDASKVPVFANAVASYWLDPEKASLVRLRKEEADAA